MQTIPGVSAQIAAGIIAEIGTDMSQFPSYANLASWAEVCPRNNESAGKKYSSKTTHGNKYLKTTILADKHRCIAARRVEKKATIAIGHKTLTAAHHIMRDYDTILAYYKR